MHLNENIRLRKRDPLLSVSCQYQVQNETETKKNQKIVENNGR